jgi:hypothetical protein
MAARRWRKRLSPQQAACYVKPKEATSGDSLMPDSTRDATWIAWNKEEHDDQVRRLLTPTSEHCGAATALGLTPSVSVSHHACVWALTILDEKSGVRTHSGCSLVDCVWTACLCVCARMTVERAVYLRRRRARARRCAVRADCVGVLCYVRGIHLRAYVLYTRLSCGAPHAYGYRETRTTRTTRTASPTPRRTCARRPTPQSAAAPRRRTFAHTFPQSARSPRLAIRRPQRRPIRTDRLHMGERRGYESRTRPQQTWAHHECSAIRLQVPAPPASRI